MQNSFTVFKVDLSTSTVYILMGYKSLSPRVWLVCCQKMLFQLFSWLKASLDQHFSHSYGADRLYSIGMWCWPHVLSKLSNYFLIHSLIFCFFKSPNILAVLQKRRQFQNNSLCLSSVYHDKTLDSHNQIAGASDCIYTVYQNLIAVGNCRLCRLKGKGMKMEDNFQSKNMVKMFLDCGEIYCTPLLLQNKI